ncbi:ribosomal protein L14-domain-containing protein [Tricharina praecox]|uniref:ribosomal protein L14-domain-containing protein n=1 Tax=Tricharina praecox TaxID=43433 RepID=UPI00221EA4BF|nr:ribosomal protein L14-domain-containing protein [Tricharina praecox]KAI5846173.1 ribosomal protein L14-domain-containing protein [Tricharina praecox]
MSYEVKASQWRLVEVGRLVLINDGPSKGKLATIVEIIDHKRVLIDSPDAGVPRQSFPLAHVSLTSIILTTLPRGARTGVVAKVWEKEGVAEKWAKSALAKRIASTEKRWALNDFDRFKVMVLKKQRRFEVKKAVAKAAKASA